MVLHRPANEVSRKRRSVVASMTKTTRARSTKFNSSPSSKRQPSGLGPRGRAQQRGSNHGRRLERRERDQPSEEPYPSFEHQADGVNDSEQQPERVDGQHFVAQALAFVAATEPFQEEPADH